MPRIIGWVAAIAAVALIATYFWLQRAHQAVESPASPAPTAPPPPERAAEAQIRFPLPAPNSEKPLPALDASDKDLRAALSGLGVGPNLVEQAVFEDFIRRVVATIDNLPAQKIPLRLLPVKPAPGKFMVAEDAAGLRLKPENSARYAPYMRALEAIDIPRLVALYVRYYPLFQQAYQDLGYPQGYFNDRLIVVIDHLLATPEVTAPVRLIQPKVTYQFADPELEACSAGQKTLMRMGNANAATIKDKLRAIRRELLAFRPKNPG